MPNNNGDRSKPCIGRNCVYRTCYCTNPTTSDNLTYLWACSDGCPSYATSMHSKNTHSTTQHLCGGSDSEYNSSYSVGAFQSFCTKDIGNKDCDQCFSVLGTQLGLAMAAFLVGGAAAAEGDLTATISAMLTAAGGNPAEAASLAVALVSSFAYGSYINGVTLTQYTISMNKTYTLTNNGNTVPITCTNGLINFNGCTLQLGNTNSPDLYTNSLTVLNLLISPNTLNVYSGGTNSFTGKPNSLFIFNISQSKLRTSFSNIFTSLYYSFVLNNSSSTEADILDYFSKKVGFSVNGYDYFRNDYYYNYASYNTALFYTNTDKSINYPLQCCRISAQIYFLWELVYHYANINSITVDINFAIKFYTCIYENMNNIQIITTSMINASFSNLLPSMLDSTINYWVGKINKAINVTNILILKHVFELLDYNIAELTKNNVNILSDPNSGNSINFFDLTTTLNKIFKKNSEIYSLNTLMVSHFYSESPIGILPSNEQIFGSSNHNDIPSIYNIYTNPTVGKPTTKKCPDTHQNNLILGYPVNSGCHNKKSELQYFIPVSDGSLKDHKFQRS